ncbi:MAG: hypothetical protein U5L09_13840 [Bacteroidales bacterium]|nr:hypothetical protein [Bacteroidales bacterium]
MDRRHLAGVFLGRSSGTFPDFLPFMKINILLLPDEKTLSRWNITGFQPDDSVNPALVKDALLDLVQT